MQIKSMAFAAIVATIAIIAVSRAHSCSCIPAPPPRQAFEGADAVLMGRVLSIKNGPPPCWVTAEIEVTKIWKGDENLVNDILTTSDLGAMCGFYFQVGKTYLIYAYENQDGRLETSNCSRSRSKERAAEDFAFLLSLGKKSDGCGSKNIFAGDIYLFLGMMLYLLRGRIPPQNSSNKESA